jgi:hypothetical protein
LRERAAIAQNGRDSRSEEKGMTRALAAAAGLALCVTTAVAADAPTPRMFGDAPPKGQWRMEILEATMGAKAEGQMPRTMTMCTDNLMQSARQPGGAASPRGRERDSGCTSRLLKDTATEAVMESVCKDRTQRTTMKRESSTALLIETEQTGSRGTSVFRARYTYEGACKDAPAASLGQESEACKQMRAQAAQMDPATACAQAGAGREACEKQMRQSMAQMQAMCK